MNEKTPLPNFKDRLLWCLDCQKEFVFTVGEQQFFWSKGLAEPKRCKSCRQIRKATIVSENQGVWNGNN